MRVHRVSVPIQRSISSLSPYRSNPALNRRCCCLARLVSASRNHNKVTFALAKKLTRICYATLRDGESYRDLSAYNAGQRPEQKLPRESFEMQR